MFGGVKNPAWGRDGEQECATGRVDLADGPKLRSNGRQLIKSGQRLKVRSPYCGGCGSPVDRTTEWVAEDLATGMITYNQAVEDYGMKE